VSAPAQPEQRSESTQNLGSNTGAIRIPLLCFPFNTLEGKRNLTQQISWKASSGCTKTLVETTLAMLLIPKWADVLANSETINHTLSRRLL
jgi:hypothetical protein